MIDETDWQISSKILIIDKSQTDLRLLTTILTSKGHQVWGASDRKTAIETLCRIPPDLILMDIHNAEENDYQIFQELHASCRHNRIPVIIIHKMDEPIENIPDILTNVLDDLLKPFFPKEVLKRVEIHLKLLNQQKQLDAQNARLEQEISERKKVELELQKQRQAEEALLKSQNDQDELLEQIRKKEQQVREIMNSVPEGVLLIDETGRMIQANQVVKSDLETLLGIHEGDIITKIGPSRLGELLAPPHHGLWHEVTIEGRIFEIISRPTAVSPIAKRWVMVIRDVTQAREYEARSHQQDRLAAVGQLATGIAHDFNNILAVIMMYSDMALGTPDLTPIMKERLLIISKQSKRASDLIQQILDFSRRTTLERRPIDLRSFLKEQIKLLKSTLPENIRIDLTAKSGSYVVNADPTRIQQAIMNLAFNARDAMPEGGRFAIQLDRLEPSEQVRCVACGTIQPRDWIRIQFSDNGMGIPPDVLSYIFEPFFTTKSKGLGSGLGLSQVFGIAETHMGHINVASSPEKGTTFTLFLPPISEKRHIESPTDPSAFIRGKGQLILVVEDEPATRQAIKDGLTLLNYQVVCTKDGIEALDYLNNHPDQVALVLSDVVMPKMGGIALLKAIREKGFKIPVILMTGHPLQDELDNLLQEGLTAWLFKPPRLKNLAKLIGETFTESFVSQPDNFSNKSVSKEFNSLN